MCHHFPMVLHCLNQCDIPALKNLLKMFYTNENFEDGNFSLTMDNSNFQLFWVFYFLKEKKEILAAL